MTDAQLYKALFKTRKTGESRDAWARRMGINKSTMQRWDEQRPALRPMTRELLIGKLGLA
jgi:DNA-binding transcriptional regulator YiaG